MNILHYSLGFPPYRSGGLTKFCLDLMVQQAKEGNNVSLLWPGEMKWFSNKVKIKEHEKYVVGLNKINSYEIINPLPISYDEGIEDINAFILDIDKGVYSEFLRNLNLDVIHMHTLMGLHKSFLEAAKELNIKLVFTAHDFFPICPKVTMYRNKEICNCAKDCGQCEKCNKTALSLNKIRLLQSPIYRNLKDSNLAKKLRKRHRDEFLEEKIISEDAESHLFSRKYFDLRKYYESMIQLMDVVHFNSILTKDVYTSFFKIKKYEIISITHSDIKDKRKLKTYNDDLIRIRYLGPQGGAKGFFSSRRH